MILRASGKSTVAIVVTALVLLAVPLAAVSGGTGAAAENRVIMCGRSVMYGWFEHWGWDGEDSHPVSRNGYVLQHGRNLEGLGEMAGIFREICDSVPAGTSPVMFFKFCFVDFYGDNLAELQGIIDQVIQTAQDRSLRLIIGNALPQVASDTTPQLVSEHRSFNSWLVSRAAQTSNVWVYDMYGVLSDGAGNLKAGYASGGGLDSHPNAAGYNALDSTYFPFLDVVFASGPAPSPTPVPPPQVKRSWYFAEGTTREGFEEFICVQNPTASTATVQAIYMTTGASGAGAQEGAPFTVAAGTRSTINVGDVIRNSDVSVRVNSDQDVICERSVYWSGRVEGHDSIGVLEPSQTWYLPEGTTREGFEEYVCIQNPQSSSATVNVTYNTSSGPINRDPLTVEANSRWTIPVHEEGLGYGDVSTVLYSDKPVVAERAMYWDGRRGGHSSIGVPSPGKEWQLAEGSTRWGYSTYILVQNPTTGTATVNATFLTTGGPVSPGSFTVEPGSRYTIVASDVLPQPADFSTKVTSDRDVTVERSMYWDNGTGKAGHDTIGVKEPNLNCFLAEGSTNYGFDTYVLISNPNNAVNNVQVTYMTANGVVPREGIPMDPYTRFTVHVNEDITYPIDTSIQVVGNLPIMAERAMYWHENGGGHVSIGLLSR